MLRFGVNLFVLCKYQSYIEHVYYFQGSVTFWPPSSEGGILLEDKQKGK